MTKASDNEFPSLLIKEGTAPSSPSAGDQRVYIDSSDHKLKRKNSGGTVTVIEGLPDQGNASYLDFTVGSAPATPSSGLLRLYALTGKHMYQKDDAGSATALDGAGGGGVATDTIWDAKGDLAVGTGADTAAKLSVGADGLPLKADSSTSTGLVYGGSSALWEALINSYSPVHWWKFDEASGNFADGIGSLTLTPSGGSTSYHQTDPWGGTSAARLNASSAATSGLGSIPTGANARTLIMLMKCTLAAPSVTKSIMAYGATSTRNYFMYQLFNTTSTNVYGDTLDLWSEAAQNQGAKAGDGLWHLIAAYIIGNQMYGTYIDGQVVQKTAGGAISTTASGNFNVNADTVDLYVGDVAIFNSWLGRAKLDRLWEVLRAAL